MADTSTKEGRERRLAEINGTKVEYLKGLYHKTHDKKYLWILQRDFGMDLDYILGVDDDLYAKEPRVED